MKTRFYRKMAMFLAFVLIVPMFWDMNLTIANAATSPTFVQTKIEIVGTGETYQLEIKDKVDKSKYSWSSSNTGVATVNDKGLVTSVSKGSSTIRCKITYPTKKTKTLSSKVTVTIPADEIDISNATLKNGAHLINLNETYDFDYTVFPVESSDKVFWSVGGGDPDCIRIDDPSTGKITATKAGKVILMATAAKSATADAAALSIVNDAVILEVVGPTATVKNVEITNSNTMTATFDSPVIPSTVIGTSSVLSDNVTVSLSKDTKGVLADDPGALTASLSADGKTLTITAKNSFNGFYGVNFSSGILTTGGIALESYYKKINYIDTAPPAYSASSVDDSGYIATITFTEPLNFTNLKISGAALVSTTGTQANATSLSVLNNVLNYTVSADKKSMSINMKSISPLDYGKLFQIYISGVTDLQGNAPANMYITAYVQADTSYKPQAVIKSLQRTAYKTITATFDRAIQFGGYIQIAGGSSILGTPDTTDAKKVYYTLSDADAILTGVKLVNVSGWNSYNVNPTDISAYSPHNMYVDFTADQTSPILTNYEFNADKGVLTLTYNEDVTLTIASGIFVSTYTSLVDDIRPNTNITYAKQSHTEGNNIIKLQLTGANTLGTYVFTLPQGFVTDNFRNQSVSRAMVLTTTNGSSNELPAPYSVAQSTSSLSQIYVRFMNKLDAATAKNTNNYTIAGLQILTAELSENTPTGATVILTVADGSIVVEGERPVTIKGVMGYNNSYSAITSYSGTVALKENVRPTCNGAVFDTTTKNIVRLNFSEPITGSISVKTYSVVTNATYEVTNSITYNGNSVLINLPQIPANNSFLRIEITSNTLTDVNGNTVLGMQTVYMAGVNY